MKSSKLKKEFQKKLKKAIKKDSFEYMYLDEGILLLIMGKPKKGESHEDFAKRLTKWQNKIMNKFEAKNPDKNYFNLSSKDFFERKHLVDHPIVDQLPKDVVENMKGIGIIAILNVKTFYENLKKIASKFGFEVETKFEDLLKSPKVRLNYPKYKNTYIDIDCTKGWTVMILEIESMNYYRQIIYSAKTIFEKEKAK